MIIGDTVYQNYSGLHRYGKVIEVKKNVNGDGWKWVKIEWVNDEKFITSQKWKAKLRNKNEDHFIPEYYRCDDVQVVNVCKALETLIRLQ